MPSRQATSYDMANCFPSMQCLTGTHPSDCASNPNLICPILPLSSPTDPNATMHFSTSTRTNSTITTSSDSEDSLAGHPSNSNTTYPYPTHQHSPSPPLPSTTPARRPHRRVPHTIIERRYRDNLNTSIETLRLSLPTLKNAYITSPDVEDSALPPRLPSKAMIIATAAGYIKELEGEKARAMEEAGVLRSQVEELQRLINCGDCSILQYLQTAGGQGGMGQMAECGGC